MVMLTVNAQRSNGNESECAYDGFVATAAALRFQPRCKT